MKPYNDIWYESYDGHRLYARDYWETESDVTLVCIPGLTRNSADFSRFCDYASDSHRVIAVDLRGRGNSAYDPQPANYHPGTYARDMLDLLDRLQLESIVLVGTSLGGIVSMFMASMLGPKLVGVIVNDIGPDLEIGGIERIKSYVADARPAKDWSEAIKRTRELHGRFFPDMDDDEWEHFARNIYREDETGRPVHNYDPNIAGPFSAPEEEIPSLDLWPVFQTLGDTPTLLLRGELSDILSTQCVEKMRAYKPDLEFVEIPRVGHAPSLNEPQSRAAIEQFLQTIGA
jgi:pimeloyl-ACP methyl ester carboxylesterase